MMLSLDKIWKKSLPVRQVGSQYTLDASFVLLAGNKDICMVTNANMDSYTIGGILRKNLS